MPVYVWKGRTRQGTVKKGEMEAVMCQALIPRANGPGRAMALEIMIPNPAIRNLIREDKVHQIYSAMQVGQDKFGMQTMNQSLASIYQRRLITLDDALGRSPNHEELRTLISQGAAGPPGRTDQKPKR